MAVRRATLHPPSGRKREWTGRDGGAGHGLAQHTLGAGTPPGAKGVWARPNTQERPPRS
ncbi:uncharacterized protein PGTG_15842 [Puccinia graminis f. sp. tritici CRL 75-36-700-3]|uniref:Uncharacterized protein n=1 Tax=Puccinia graminis f. sp. tritici (strain CRL 75-36-700-3 / race SCCL) TaxID=418459 RepID=E3L005_PUCGT|nr:uncharacterized protein PGTG_15842 [Puccinia graminis f. sp. tritici CRL 75-36-700-3]EFP89886.2 hypothetical protein PGTG_15842 [Puccinia graminis f. sp. tritici CRL 75-36-700-3]